MQLVVRMSARMPSLAPYLCSVVIDTSGVFGHRPVALRKNCRADPGSS